MDSRSATTHKTFLSQVNSTACKRLKLQRREKIIFFRLLGFLVRNHKPFPYPVQSLSENTGYSRSSVFEALNELERLRLIKRQGFTNTTKYTKGSIMVRICSLVQNRSKKLQSKNCPLVQKLDELGLTSPETGYIRTYRSEHKEKGYNLKYHIYLSKFKSGVELGLTPKNQKPMTLEEFELSPVE